MALKEIPLRPDLRNYAFETTLDGATYTLDLRWNIRASAWFMSIFDSEGVALIQGKKVVTGAVLNKPTLVTGTLPGEIMVLDFNDLGGSPGEDDLGIRFSLFYLEAS